MHNIAFDENFSKIHHHFTRILWASVHFVKQGECLRIQCKLILPHGGAKILQDFWSEHKVETTEGGFLKKRKGSIYVCQDPLYRALLVLGLGDKVQINVMSTLGIEEIKAAFIQSFYSACKGQPTNGWDKWVRFCQVARLMPGLVWFRPRWNQHFISQSFLAILFGYSDWPISSGK